MLVFWCDSFAPKAFFLLIASMNNVHKLSSSAILQASKFFNHTYDLIKD